MDSGLRESYHARQIVQIVQSKLDVARGDGTIKCFIYKPGAEHTMLGHFAIASRTCLMRDQTDAGYRFVYFLPNQLKAKFEIAMAEYNGQLQQNRAA